MGTGGREGEGGDWAGLLIAGCDRVCVGDWLGTGGCLWKGVGKKEGVEGGAVRDVCLAASCWLRAWANQAMLPNCCAAES